MSLPHPELRKRENVGNQSVQKPIEIYLFTNPLCSKYWALEPYIKKMILEFGHYFTLRTITNNNLQLVCLKQTDSYKNQKKVIYPCLSLAIKAAELQGKNAGRKFLRQIQTNYFIKSADILDLNTLLDAAKVAGLDVSEYRKDLYSKIAKKALMRDLHIIDEMEVENTPTVVAFNPMLKDHGVKLSGVQPYEVYLLMIQDMLQTEPIPAEKPTIENFVAKHRFVTRREIAIIYDTTIHDAQHILEKLEFRRIVKREQFKNGVLWSYTR